MQLWAVLCGVAALSSSAFGTQVADPYLSTGPGSWAERPDTSAMQAARPAGVVSRGYAGLSCQAGAAGRLTNCKVQYGYPAGKGFDRAALSLVPIFRLSAETVAAAHYTGSRVSVMFGWGGDGGPCLPPNCSPIPPPPPPPSGR
jgi:hypothetical protein